MRWLLVASLCLVMLCLGACGAGEPSALLPKPEVQATSRTPGTTSPPSSTTTTNSVLQDQPSLANESYSHEDTATIFLPQETTGGASPPLFVLVPGGAWTSADPTGLAPLGAALAEAGAVAVTISYRTSSDGALFPVPAEDISCGVSYAVAASRETGYEPLEVVLIGHSAGAQLSALVALRGGDFGRNCANPAVEVDGMVGLAGPYDVGRARAVALFGDDAEASTWSAGNPLDHVGIRPNVRFLLIHGTGDTLVPIEFTKSFVEALEVAGHEVQANYPDLVDHVSVYTPDVVSELIADWSGLGD